jgi:hypothetical protein
VRGRRLIWLWGIGLGILGLVAAVWLVWTGDFWTPSRVVLTIPKGTFARLKAGTGAEAIPAKIQLRVGDLFVLRNEDTASHRVGGFYVRPGESLSYRFSQAGTFDFICTIHRDGHAIFQVDARPSLDALWWTEIELLGLLILLSGLQLGALSTWLGTSALATGSLIALLGLFLTINFSDRRLGGQPVQGDRPLPSVKSL